MTGWNHRTEVHTRRSRFSCAPTCTARCKGRVKGSQSDSQKYLVLCLGFNRDILCSVYQKCGTKNRTRFIDFGKLASSLGDSICDALIGLHAFTGCDNVSALTGRGKLGALKLMKKDSTYQETFSQPGQSWEFSKFNKIQLFTCHLYATTGSTDEVNELRCQLFCAKLGQVESSQLPPCRYCLHMHVLRANNYQASIWKCCLQTQPFVADPKDCGWKTDGEGHLAIEWMRTPPAPDAVLELLSCKCLRSCKLLRCTCLANGLACTNICKLQACSNQKKEEQFAFELGDSDDGDGEDD